MMNKKGIWLVVVGTYFCLAAIVSAQTGRWVEYDPTEFGSGTALYDRGDGCIGYCRDGSQYFLIFDANIGEWRRFNLGQSQDFTYVQTKGDVVFGYSSTVLIAYSAQLQQWDTLSYDGSILFEDWQEGKRSYGCANDYAFMSTDQKVYIFEAALGSWTEFAYTIPADYMSGKFYPFEDYLFLQLSRSTSYTPPMNIVYSLHTSSFNSLDYGGNLYAPFLRHGFATTVALDGSADNFNLIGYSTFDNQFDVQSYSTAESEGSIGRGTSWADELGNHTTYVMGFRRSESSIGRHCNYYCYDTRRGVWDHHYVFHDVDDEQYSGSLMTGGQFACDHALNEDTKTYNHVFYSGLTGQFLHVGSDLIYKSTTAKLRAGGTVFMQLDEWNAWAYDIVNERSSQISLAYSISNSLYIGDDFASFLRWDPDSTNMRVYFYNSRTDNWSSFELPEQYNQTGWGTPYIYMYNGDDNNEVIFYTTYRDEIIRRPHPSGSYLYSKIRGDLAYSRTDGQSYLFNARTGQVVEFDFNLNQNGLGTHSGTFANVDSRTLYGYSIISGNTSSMIMADDPYYVSDTGYIGIVTTQTANKVYAFNSFADSWVELTPAGYNVQLLVGTKTALVVRSSPDRLYAFDPQGIITGVNDEPDIAILPQTPVLSQNYPNPFNPTTSIEFDLPRRSIVKISIYNLLGQEIAELANQVYPVGKHRITWDGNNSSGVRASTGVYFYRLVADDCIDTKKMLLLK